jgi:hypothetical protein
MQMTLSAVFLFYPQGTIWHLKYFRNLRNPDPRDCCRASVGRIVNGARSCESQIENGHNTAITGLRCGFRAKERQQDEQSKDQVVRANSPDVMILMTLARLHSGRSCLSASLTVGRVLSLQRYTRNDGPVRSIPVTQPWRRHVNKMRSVVHGEQHH